MTPIERNPTPRISMQQQPLQSVRKRARKACESCRKRKRRCDGSQPCRACIEYEYECHYADQPTASTTIGEQSRSATITSHFAEARAKTEPDLNHRTSAHGSLVDSPQVVARSVYGRSIPVSHSFGFNIGMPISDKLLNPVSEALRSAMCLDAAEKFCQTYRDSSGLLFPLIDSEVLLEELRKLFASAQAQQPTSPVEVAITFAVLLGSYFSWPLLADRHDALLLHAQQELDRLTFRQQHTGGQWLLRAWMLKTLLLRMTSVPDLVWLSSCNMMHIAELTEGTFQPEVVPSDATGSIAPEEKFTIFSLAWTLNQMISLASGRSTTIHPDSVLHEEEEEEEANQTEAVFRLHKTFRRIQELEINNSVSAARTCLLELCHDRITSSITLDARTILIEACALCGVYRQILKQGGCLHTEAVSAIKPVLQSALTAAEELVDIGEPWFMLAEFPSQLACICLALGRPLLDLLPRVSILLRKTTQRFESDTLKQTEKTVSLLVEVCLKSRDEDTSTVRRSLQCLSSSGNVPTSVEDEIWSQFLNQQVFD